MQIQTDCMERQRERLMETKEIVDYGDQWRYMQVHVQICMERLMETKETTEPTYLLLAL